MWLRQEYKPEKQRFEKPFELEIDRDLLTRQADDRKREFIDKSVLRLEQSYTALGTTVWDGSIALAKMFDNKETFPSHYLQTCRVLELGAGCGLVGIYICLLGAKMTFLTDQKCCVKTLETNVKSNIPQFQRDKIKVMEYSWGTNTDELTKGGSFDLVLAAEVLYSQTDSLQLAHSIPKLTNEKSRIFVALGRNRGGEEIFVRTMTEKGYLCKEVPRNQLHPKYQDEIIKILEFSVG
ncbi:protein N-lysine methyltransferase METTL21A-like [Acropora palmata]|uniref:protein N-lysine methyltransferase METTL21A-like n=1 Tax=Acropora palmata TaxID=6131 RepID=UPI003DA09124